MWHKAEGSAGRPLRLNLSLLAARCELSPLPKMAARVTDVQVVWLEFVGLQLEVNESIRIRKGRSITHAKFIINVVRILARLEPSTRGRAKEKA